MSDEHMEKGIVYRKCQVCGKPVVTLHPTQWAYKKRRGKNDYTFWCSWKCLREAERKANMKKLTLEKKRRAVEIALAGGNPLDYLRENGIVNAAGSWAKIKNTLKYEDPQTYAKIPQRIAPAKATETPAVKEEKSPETAAVSADEIVRCVNRDDERPLVELVYDRSIAEEYRKEQEAKAADYADPPAAPVETVCCPLTIEGFAVRCVENEFGKFFYDVRYNLIDWTSPDGEKVSFTPEGWKEFATVALPKAMAILGVQQ